MVLCIISKLSISECYLFVMKYLIGIDEVGRGPLAGHITLCAVCVPENFSKSFFKGIKDSKKMSVEKREEWYEKVRVARANGILNYAVAFVSHKIIDKKGITFATRLAIKRLLKRLNAKPENTKILLDGSLYAPKEFKNQKTIIKGDEKIPVISLSSIVAKVRRDKRMVNLSKIFPQYGFDVNKGYGTREHIKAIKKFGITPVHRRLFLRSILK